MNLNQLEAYIDSNEHLWTEQGFPYFQFNLPMYMSYFREQDLAVSNEKLFVSTYYRSSSDSNGTPPGRSYSILLTQIQPLQSGKTLEQWLIENKKNVHVDENGTQKEFELEPITIGSLKGFLIDFSENGSTPWTSMAYFHTKEGIRGLGYTSVVPDQRDYMVWKKVLQTIRIN